METQYKRAADMPSVKARRQLTKMADLAGRDLLLRNFVPFSGRYGQGYRVMVTDMETGDEYTTITTAVVICDVLDGLDPEADLPCVVRWDKNGRYWDIQ